jgi:hypothetical protein
MDSRERVRRTLSFSNPDRVPFDLWVLPWANLHHPKELESIQRDYPNDISVCPVEYHEPPTTSGEQHARGTYIDEWGCEFINLQDGVIGEVKQPLIEDWRSDLEKVRLPKEWLTFDRDAVNAFCRSTDKFVSPDCCPRPFERLQFLRGTENLYLDLADPPAEFHELLKRVHAFYCELLEEWAKTPVDCLRFMDDWGAQRSLLISPKLWREIFRPLYRDYIEIAHSHGKPMFMHSDGCIIDIIPDLIEIGLDALNSQVFCMGIDKLSPFRGKITFWGEVDRQHLLPNGALEDVHQAVREFHETLYHKGGIIGQCEFGLAAKPENVREVFRSWSEVCGE